LPVTGLVVCFLEALCQKDPALISWLTEVSTAAFMTGSTDRILVKLTLLCCEPQKPEGRALNGRTTASLLSTLKIDGLLPKE
jgi:hypothetical protein